MPAPNPYPIILAHGIARFDIIRQLYLEKFGNDESDDDDLHYFKGIRSYLVANGFAAYHTSVSFAADVATRAQELGAQINGILQQSQARKVHVIAHSMGGLDARHLIVDVPGMADKIASLTTIGTPHLGTIAADTAINLGGQKLIDSMRPMLELSGYRDLTIEACAQFNQRAEPSEASNHVVYQTYSSSQTLTSILFVLHASWLLLKAKEGDNDGLVSVASQAWQSELKAIDGCTKSVRQYSFPFPADHINQVGWWLPGNFTTKDGLFNVAKQRRDYEMQVQNLYLEIARGLPVE